MRCFMRVNIIKYLYLLYLIFPFDFNRAMFIQAGLNYNIYIALIIYMSNIPYTIYLFYHRINFNKINTTIYVGII